jgi:hypothetical protein
MKKSIVMLLAVLAAGTASAQWTWGLKLGTNLATMSGFSASTQVDGTKKVMKTGCMGGFVVEYSFADSFGLQGELYYSRQGYSLRNTSVDMITGDPVDNSRFRDLSNYINLPVILKYYPMPGLSIELGPQIGYMISGATTYRTKADAPQTSGASKTITTEKDIISASSHHRCFDYGVTAGASYELWHGVSFTARYYYGLRNISNVVNPLGEDPQLHNSVVQLGITTRF